MLRIGDFARLTRVSIKTLHHYDDIGLLKAAFVDPFTSYRYYTFDQLPRLNRILVLRGLGFSLAQIASVLGDRDGASLNVDELRGMLKMKQVQLQQDIQTAQRRLSEVEFRLHAIEQEARMSDVEILVKPVETVMIVGAREVVRDVKQMRERCMALNDRAYAPIGAGTVRSDGISLALYHNADEAGIDVEMAYAVIGVPPVLILTNGSQLHELPAALVAYSVYQGSYDDFNAVGRVHSDLTDWIAANGYHQSGASREYYLRPPQSAGDVAGVMEIQYPIQQKA